MINIGLCVVSYSKKHTATQYCNIDCHYLLLDAVDRDDTAILVLVDLSAAFDTVDHGILLERLRVTFGVDDTALAWFRSCLLYTSPSPRDS